MSHWHIQKIILTIVTTLGLIYIVILMYPSFIFKFNREYKQCNIYSDRPIDITADKIIDRALQLISKSDLYDSSIHFNIYICNDLNRFFLFTLNRQAGAVTQYNLRRNIFLRSCDIKNNKIIPAASGILASYHYSIADRPLTYYFAHEMTHVLESNYTGRFHFTTPKWLTEGYADYIGKGGNFNFLENLALLRANAPELNPQKGLYKYYHLLVEYLLHYKKITIKQLYENTPDPAEIILEINKTWPAVEIKHH